MSASPAAIKDLEERVAWHQATVHHATEQAAEKRRLAEQWDARAAEAQTVVDNLVACVYFLEDSPQ